jgi:signal transduction histidine kinase
MEAISHARRTRGAAILLLLLPGLHPLLIPTLGAPSHLLWFAHVAAVGLLTFQSGRPGAVAGVAVSAVWVAVGELLFGAGYGTPADGTTVVALTFSVALMDALVAAFALDARSLARRYHHLFDESRVPMLKLDPDGRVRGVNRALRELLGAPAGWTPEGLPDILVHPSPEALEAEASGDLWSGRMEIQLYGGATRPLQGDLVLLRDPEGEGRSLIVSDRSMEANQREELERQSTLASLGEALAGVAHELNNPLAVISAHAQMGAEVSEDADAREAFQVVAEESARMSGLVKELLGYSRKSGDAGGGSRVHDVVRRLVRVQQVAAGREVVIEALVEWEGVVAAESQHLQQVLQNLVSNAAYAARRGETSPGRVQVAVRREGDGRVLVEVADSGTGIAPEVRDTLFQPFVTTKPDGEGTGLGLAICRRLARGWGGDLQATNRREGGALFRLSLTPVNSPGAGTEVRTESGSPAPGGDRHGPHPTRGRGMRPAARLGS